MLELIEALNDLRPDERYSIDTETTGLRPWGDTTLRGVSLYVRGKAYYWPVSHPHSENYNEYILAAALKHCQGMPVYHNANYDRAILERAGFINPKHYRDTQIIAWLEDENRPKALKKLGELMFGLDASAEQKALKHFMRGETKAASYKRLRDAGLSVADARAASASTKRTWADLTAVEIAPYAKQDAQLTYNLYDRLLADSEYTLIEPAVQRMHDLQDVVYRMVKRGVQISPETVWQKSQEAQQEIVRIRKNFSVNLDSPQQLSKLLYQDWGLPVKERTATDAPSTSRAALEALAGMHPGLDEILQYRRWQKAESTYYQPLLEAVDSFERVHPHVNVIGTVTARFSYSDPNLQTIPREGTISGVKECFVARPGKILVSYDLKQAELRFMASLSGERALIEALERGDDLYQQVADSIGTTRQIGKGLVLSWPYGVGPNKFAKTAGISAKLAKQYIHGFEQTYSNLSNTMHKLSIHAERYGRLPLIGPGHFRRFVGPSLQWPIPSYTALNSACQNGVAHFMGDVMIRIEEFAEAYDAELVLQVHDALTFEVVPGTEELIGQELLRIANEVNPLDMPLIWDLKYGL